MEGERFSIAAVLLENGSNLREDSLFRVCNAGLLSVRDSRTGLQART